MHKSIIDILQEHPDYPSLLAISDCLNYFNIRNEAYNLDLQELSQLDGPFVVQVRGDKTGQNFFSVAKNSVHNHITFLNPETHKWEKRENGVFQQSYTGFTLLVDPSENIKERDYEIKKDAENKMILYKWLSVSIFLLIIAVNIINIFKLGQLFAAISISLFQLLSVAGIAIGSILLLYEIDQFDLTFHQICGGRKKSNCSAVLSSKGASFFGISWSRIGTVFFVGQFFSILLTWNQRTSALPFISLLSIMSLPYVIYSVYYQWRIAKQWCLLCLSAQVVIILQNLIVITNKWFTADFFFPKDNFPIFMLIFSFLLSILIVNTLVLYFKKSKETQEAKISLQRIRRNPEIFRILLSKGKKIDVSTSLGITLGSPNANLKIVKVCNPYCGPCARSHEFIDQLLKYNDDVQIRIIFTTTDKENDKSSAIVKLLLAIAQNNDEELTKNALHDWYTSPVKDYNIFEQKYKNYRINEQNLKIETMNNWCRSTKINFTPTFFINGSQLPENYYIDDIKFFPVITLTP